MSNDMYSIDNCLPLGTAPSYTWVPAGTPDTIGMDFDQGPNVPSDVNGRTSSRWVLMDGVRQVQASGIVDDRVTMLLPGMLYTSSPGAPHPFSVEPYTPAAGVYPCCITHYNIPDYPMPTGNRSLLRGSVGELPEVILTPNLNTPAETCPVCSCAAGVSIV